MKRLAMWKLVPGMLFGLLAWAAVAIAVPLSDAHKQALHVIAEYAHGSVDLATHYLAKLGFRYSPPIGEDVWSEFPTVRKIEAAYVAAEAAAPDKGGQVLLFKLANELAQDFAAIRKEAALQAIFKSTFAAPETLEFRQPPAQAPPPLPKPIRDAVKVVSHYASGGAVGDSPRLFARYLQVSEDEAYEVLRSSETHEQALERGLFRHSSAKQVEILRRMTQDLNRQYKTIYAERGLAGIGMYRPDASDGFAPQGGSPGPKDPHQGPGTPPQDGGGLGSDGGADPYKPRPDPSPPEARKSADVSTYKKFVQESYGNPGGKGRAFRRAVTTLGGFGGVIFGNEVSSEGIPRVRSIRFVPANVPGKPGALVAEMDGGVQAQLRGVSASEAAIARAMIFDRFQADIAWHPDELIGLVGAIRATREPVFDIVLHPTLKDSSLGRAAVVVDLAPSNAAMLLKDAKLPAVRQALASMFRLMEGKESSPDSAAEVEQARNWLTTTNERVIERFLEGVVRRSERQEVSLSKEPPSSRLWHIGTWKVVDVPIRIVREGAAFVLERADYTKEFPLGLRRAAFIEMRSFAVQSADAYLLAEQYEFPLDWDRRFAAAFYRSVPILTSTYRPYAEVNRFARVLAFVRWARIQGALFPEMKSPAENLATPSRIRVTRNGIQVLAE